MTFRVKIGDRYIGGGEPPMIQTMTTVKASDRKASIEQIKRLKEAGAEAVRFAVSDPEDADAITDIKREIKGVGLIADIQYDYKLAVAACKNGIDKVRINPGNMGGRKNIEYLASLLKEYNIPVRVGANGGSLKKEAVEKYGRSAKALCESALKEVAEFEKFGVENIVISVKSSDLKETVEAYREISKLCDYPLHIGLTESGTLKSGLISSAIAVGALLLDGIGDTVRISLAADPAEEVYAAKRILRSLGIIKDYVKVVSCPTCGRCDWNSIELAEKIEEMTADIDKPLKIAVMGCAVNGVGEASDCDIGIAGSGKYAVIFKKGEVIKMVEKSVAVEEFIKETEKFL